MSHFALSSLVLSSNSPLPSDAQIRIDQDTRSPIKDLNMPVVALL